MHACGHDMHISCLTGAAELLSAAKKESKGTVIYLFRLDEERGQGTKAMLEVRRQGKIPRPDYTLGRHVAAEEADVVAIHASVFHRCTRLL